MSDKTVRVELDQEDIWCEVVNEVDDDEPGYEIPAKLFASVRAAWVAHGAAVGEVRKYIQINNVRPTLGEPR